MINRKMSKKIRTITRKASRKAKYVLPELVNVFGYEVYDYAEL